MPFRRLCAGAARPSTVSHVEPDAVTGRPHELIDRLMHVLDRDPDDDGRWWANAAIWASVALGCTGEVERCRDQRMSIDAVADRLRNLVEAGVDEAFIVGAVRDLLGQRIGDLADLEEAGRGVNRLREVLRRAETDPAALRDGSPQLAHLSDEKILETTRRMLDEATLTPEEVERRQRVYARWQDLAGQWLSGDALGAWSARSAVPGR